ncbi:MAG: beta-ketoacyl synthase N-terminal-like domain-containing protein, partial [Stackebrandtia sp.]
MSDSVPSSQPPVAIVGMSALVPGSPGVDGFWRTIYNGLDQIGEVPPTRWPVEDYYDPDPDAPDKTYGKRGSFLDPVEFDLLKFGISPNMIEATDATQLLSLVLAEQVLTDACDGDTDKLSRERVSVLLGTSTLELLGSMSNRMQRPVWLKSLRECGVPEAQAQAACDRIAEHYVPWQVDTFPGLLSNVVAGRIAHRFDLHGTNHTVDAACASSLAALHSGVNELALGQTDLVITGGVDLLNDIVMYMCFSKTPAMSPTGDCRPFSDSADGTMLGESLTMFALKRLADAERDGDRIYAVLKGVGASSDGSGSAVYAPEPEGQSRALRRAYEAAGYGPETVELVEAHGTGTAAGDAAEVAALREVFAGSGDDAQRCALGSVKSQLGHTKCAAGAVGLLKTVLALHQKTLPPTIKIDKPDPKLDLESSPFYLNTETRPWVRGGDHPRRASVSSFGFGGSNFHLTLEEYLPAENAKARPARRLRAAPAELMLFSASSPDALRSAVVEACEQAQSQPLPVLARRSQREFDPDAATRLAVVASDADDLASKIDRVVARIEAAPDAPFTMPRGVDYSPLPAASREIAFLFSPQGSQYVGMGADLAMEHPQARAAWDLAAEVSPTEEPPHRAVFPAPVFT